jgi:hypothetical protein
MMKSSDRSFLDSIKLNTTNVSFSDSIIYIYPPPHLIDIRQDQSFLQRKADKLRMKVLLQPILDDTHRDKIRIRNSVFQDMPR